MCPVLVVARFEGNVICTGGYTREDALKNAWLRAASLGMVSCQADPMDSG